MMTTNDLRSDNMGSGTAGDVPTSSIRSRGTLLLCQAAARDSDRRGKPWESKPEGGRRFTSQAGRCLGGRLDHLPACPLQHIRVGGSGRHHIEVVDLLQRPRPAAYEQILAVPTLVRQLPLLIGKVVGDHSDTNRMPAGLHAGLRDDVPAGQGGRNSPGSRCDWFHKIRPDY